MQEITLFFNFMLLFILVNLYLALLMEPESFFHKLLQTSTTLYVGIILLLLNLVATGIKFNKIPFKLRYDLFAVGSIIVWFSYWPPYFRQESPLFDYFSLYFAFITALCSLVFTTKTENIDPDALDLLQWLSDSGRFNPLLIMAGVMVSLAFPQHYLLFPITITLLVTRYSLACCLNNE